MSARDLLIVDLDGTLIDSFADIERGVGAALADLGVAASAGVLALCRRGQPLEDFYRAALGRDPDDAGERDRFARFVAAYRRHYTADQRATRPYPGVAATLEALRVRRPGLRIAVGTSKRTDMARSILEQAGLAAHFDLIQGSDHVAKKPDPALLALVARSLAVPMARAVMVGDTGADVGAARAAGCTAVAVTYGGWSRSELESLGPDHLIDAFADLLAIL